MKSAPHFALVLVCLIGTDLIALDLTKDSLPTVKENITAKKAVLVDVREKEEWDSGHIADALLLPLSSLEEADDVKASLARLPKDRIIYTHCAVGVRSLKAAELLKKHGYNVRPLKAGYAELLKAGFKDAE
ncbi:putative adenylyltransferase/sulfurtransferase MoeZ [Anatilimnocola aggregata]|uniref:Putative adenylyltransferase/sulfurtransferase MoeZ n=1 Tax=Anatilimnocola aggregata TaxID=2528021 RepID=A0A517Y942_9BACT|nr:rhodanese-like domain-containing protein [Anatilimnocola aggregata]QDU26672.1 putative adenylyltransferase/sulfurtransferase MoeZ [Anatilimnocola aggregata]